MRAQASKKVDGFDQVGFALAVGAVQQVDAWIELEVCGFIVSKVGEANPFHIHSAVAISREFLFSRRRI